MEDNKKKKIEDLAKNVGKLTNDVMSVSGEAFGLLALKLGNEPLAYKSIKTMREVGADTGKNVERFLDENITKVHVRLQEEDLKDLKGKAEDAVNDLKESAQKFKETMKEKADSVITRETKIYGDADQFYKEEDKVEGIIIDEVSWKDEE
ncbi:MAG: hypothetical protein EOM07_07250 [Clostridia bacterium]|nr:hypothetical protein [Clostridia bacterium]